MRDGVVRPARSASRRDRRARADQARSTDRADRPPSPPPSPRRTAAGTRRLPTSITMNRFAAMQDWPLLNRRDLTAVATACARSAVRRHDERIAAAQFEHALLQRASGAARDVAAGAIASGQRHRLHARIVENRRHLLDFDQQRLEHALGKARAREAPLRSPARTAARSARVSAARRCRPSAPARRSGRPARTESSTA